MFFNDYPDFCANDLWSENRSHRYNAIIKPMCLKGARVLDLASNWGQWTFAALDAGAESVVGVEGRESNIQIAHDNLRKYNAPSRYEFVLDDVYSYLIDQPPGQFDVIFCLGFLYHTTRVFEILEEMKRLCPRHIVIDTNVYLSEESVMRVKDEDTSSSVNAIGDGDREVVFVPSVVALNKMLHNLGLDYRYFDWDDYLSKITNKSSMNRYADGSRVTVHVPIYKMLL
jgi:hypothetical protein